MPTRKQRTGGRTTHTVGDRTLTVTLATVRKLAPQCDRVTVPAPPSANNLFATFKGRRIKSREYKAWLAGAVPLLALLKSPAAYPCRYRILAGGKWNILRDGANAEKATIDATVAAGVITDDSLKYVRGGEWMYEPSEGEPTVTVWFEALPSRA